MGFLPIILMFVVLYFLMIRPQMKRAKEHKTMLAALKKGDEVVTAGGMVGKVTKVGESYVTLEVSRADRRRQRAIEMTLPEGARCRPCCPTARSSRSEPAASQPAAGAHHARTSDASSDLAEPDPMNRYPIWKYAIIALALVFGLLYTLPNFFGEAPAVQVSSGKATVKVEHRDARTRREPR